MMPIYFILFRRKAQMLDVFEIVTDPDLFARLRREADPDDSDPTFEPDPSVLFNISQQYARRIMYHDSDFFFKTLNKVSFRDLVLDDDFSIEDTFKFMFLFEKNKLGFGLMWLKDAVLDALEMSKEKGNVANFGTLSKWRAYASCRTHRLMHAVQVAGTRCSGGGYTAVPTLHARFPMKLGGQVSSTLLCTGADHTL
jgi:hypothetical protein